MFQAVARLIGAVMGAGVSAVLARTLNANGFAAYSLAITLLTLAGNFGDFGVSQTASRDMAREPAVRGQYLAALIIVRTALAVIMLSLAIGASLVLLQDHHYVLMVVAILVTMLLGGVNSYGVVAQARLRSEVEGFLILGQSLAWLIVVIVVWRTRADSSYIGIGYLAAGLVQSAITIAGVRKLVQPDFGSWRTVVIPLYRGAWRLGLAAVFLTAYYKVGFIVLLDVRGARAGGLYAAANRVLDTLAIGPYALLAFLVPLMASFHGHSEGLQVVGRIVGLVLRLALCLGVGVAATIVPLSPWIMGALFGPHFAAAGGTLAVLILAFIPLSLSLVGAAVLIAMDRLTEYMTITFTAALLSVAGTLGAVQVSGATGTALVAVVVESLVALALTIVMHRILPLDMNWRRLSRVLGSGVIAGAVVEALHAAAPLGALLTGVAVFGTSLVVSGALARDELRSVLTRDARLEA